MTNQRTVGFWSLMIPGILILIMLIFGQMMAFIDYEFTVTFGLQESVHVIGEFGAGDTII